MMRSMFSGVSGLQAHQVRMDVIGNNIANVNTVGFKASKVNFAEVMYQTSKGAGAPQEGRGGTNPLQIGLGTSVSSVTVQHTPGSTQRTDNPTDIMIEGDGFFVVSADATGTNKFYTRAGNFVLDKLGYLVNPAGFKVLDSEGNPVRINKSEVKGATTSTLGEITGNLNFSYPPEALDKLPAEPIYTTTMDVYDSVGKKNVVTLDFGEKLTNVPGTAIAPATGNSSFRAVQISSGGANIGSDLTPRGALVPPAAPNAVVYAQFDENGEFLGLVNNVQLDAAGNVQSATALAATNLTIQSPGSKDINIPIDNKMFKKLTHYEKTSDMKAVALDGNSAGSLTSFSISSTGDVYGIFSNGERKVLSSIGLAYFDNPPGLMKIGGNLFTDTANSGSPKFGVPGTGSFGSLTPGALEMSNVDLSKEFTDMITTQRGFQANSRVITTSDQLLEELVNLKR